MYENSYLNFLYHGIDLYSKFHISELPAAFKNKYKRLDNIIFNKNNIDDEPIILIVEKIYKVLKSIYPDIVNIKLQNILDLLYKNHYDKLFYNKILSITILEVYTDDDEKWDKEKNKIIKIFYNNKLTNIHDDSNGNYRLLSYDIFTNIEYDNYIPDICDYNIDNIISYVNLRDSEIRDNISITNFSNAIQKFIQYIKENVSIQYILPGLFSENKLTELKELIQKFIRNMNIDNICDILTIQYILFDRYIRLFCYEDEGEFNKLLSYLLSLDIFIINKIMKEYSDKFKYIYIDIYSMYNTILIILIDKIDKRKNVLDMSDNLINGYNMYYCQLMKSRDKLKGLLDLSNGGINND